MDTPTLQQRPVQDAPSILTRQCLLISTPEPYWKDWERTEKFADDVKQLITLFQEHGEIMSIRWQSRDDEKVGTRSVWEAYDTHSKEQEEISIADRKPEAEGRDSLRNEPIQRSTPFLPGHWTGQEIIVAPREKIALRAAQSDMPACSTSDMMQHYPSIDLIGSLGSVKGHPGLSIIRAYLSTYNAPSLLHALHSKRVAGVFLCGWHPMSICEVLTRSDITLTRIKGCIIGEDPDDLRVEQMEIVLGVSSQYLGEVKRMLKDNV